MSGVHKVNGLLENVKEVNCSLRNGHAENGENLSEKIAALKVESNGLSTVSEEEKKREGEGRSIGETPAAS